MVTAQAAWMLSQETGGRFILGLGTQVRAHVERRYSAAFSSPGPRMREYVQAVRAIYEGFRGTPLRFDGRFYSFSLLTPAWSPGPMDYPNPLIYVAGVRPWMCRMVGEVADGMLVHPLSTPAYLEQVVVPAIEEGREIAKRRADDVALVCPVMTAVSDDADTRGRQRESIRARIAFYGSTPGYGVVFDTSGWPGVGDELNRLQRTGDVEAMKGAITDELLDAIAITSTWAELPEKLAKRFAGRADEIVCYSVVEQWRDESDALQRWQDVNRRFNDLVCP
jgi:probable F420-dependent oxidoreductase